MRATDLCREHGISRFSMGIQAAPRGMAFGCCVVRCEQEVLDFNLRPVLLTEAMCSSDVELAAPLVMVLEKHSECMIDHFQPYSRCCARRNSPRVSHVSSLQHADILTLPPEDFSIISDLSGLPLCVSLAISTSTASTYSAHT